jgi:hypothetical protein
MQMKTIKRIFGILLLAFAFLSMFRIRTNLHSDDPKAHGKIRADIILVILFGGSGLLMLGGTGKAD